MLLLRRQRRGFSAAPCTGLWELLLESCCSRRLRIERRTPLHRSSARFALLGSGSKTLASGRAKKSSLTSLAVIASISWFISCRRDLDARHCARNWRAAPFLTKPSCSDSDRVAHACAHKGRVVVFLRNDTAFERGADGTWSPFSYGVREEDSRYAHAVSGSVLLG